MAEAYVGTSLTMETLPNYIQKIYNAGRSETI